MTVFTVHPEPAPNVAAVDAAALAISAAPPATSIPF